MRQMDSRASVCGFGDFGDDDDDDDLDFLFLTRESQVGFLFTSPEE